MKFPRSTYRLQFRNGMDFAKARRLVPYLAELGVSHLYASPVATAVNGSTHGYDVTREDEIDPVLGGIDGLRGLAEDLHERSLGLILDIVPNHMAASLENPWWRSVIAWGKESPFYRHFDIDPSEKLTLPFLGKSFEEELAAGAIRLALDPAHDNLALRYYDSFYPLHPETYGRALAGQATLAAETTPEDDPEGTGVLSSALAPPGARQALSAILDEISQDHARIAAIHDAQPWLLVDWKTAGRHISYRRFFEIAGLVGLRVEDPRVFDDSHRLILDLVREGTVDGLRIDHIDGLADPHAYLEQLRAAVGPDVYIAVEKILEKSEPFTTEWPVQGTTGYEFVASLADALADEKEAGRLRKAFASLRSKEHQGSYQEEMKVSKRQMLSENFAGEVARVSAVARSLADRSSRGLSRDTIAEAVCALIVALPVYRTYTTAGGASERDRRLVAEAREQAQRAAGPEVREALDFVCGLLVEDTMPAAECGEFRARFQQLSGPIMAKALEDTLFYRENAFLALNEVGGNPGEPTGGPAAFHAAMRARAQTTPHSLSATATHDTKRGEDARARLYTLSEAPDQWIDATRRWSMRHAPLCRPHAERTVPEPDVEWLFYQSLAGAWPIGGLQDRAALEALADRMKLYMEKALREAKTGSNWLLPDVDYEKMVAAFVEDALGHQGFLHDFDETLSAFVDAGLMNALAQTLIKLTAPGIPDIYQGSERSDFSLVDPDNRMLLDTASLRVPRKPRAERAHFMDYKQWLVATVLNLRNEKPPSPLDGPYTALETSGGERRALAFLRGTPEAFAITVVPRLTFGLTDRDTLSVKADSLQNAFVTIPDEISGRSVRSVLDGRTFTLAGEISLQQAFADEPVSLLVSV